MSRPLRHRPDPQKEYRPNLWSCSCGRSLVYAEWAQVPYYRHVGSDTATEIPPPLTFEERHGAGRAGGTDG